MVSVLNWARSAKKSENNNNNNNLFLTWRKLTSEYDQMRLTTITTCNNYNNVYLRIPKICNLKFINLTITRKSLPKLVSLYCSFKNQKVVDVSDTCRQTVP